MNNIIPAPVIAVVADIAAEKETYASLDSLFMYAGAAGEPPGGSKPVKTQEWLRQTNKECSNPLEVLGMIIERYMEEEPEDNPWEVKKENENRIRIEKVLARSSLKYFQGGRVAGGLAAPTKSLEEHIRNKDVQPLNDEFDRALSNVELKPREALSAACNLLESLFKIFIEEERLEMPKKKDIKSTWNVVRKRLNFDPSSTEDRDLQEILSGMASVVGGIGALRTHASTAHGLGNTRYKVEPRHARLAVHSAHTIALFILESWVKQRET